MSKLRILDFDIENRPLAYLSQDFTTGEITAIAACWDGQPKTMQVWLLGQDQIQVMLEEFRVLYNEADMVTGHYIRMHDLPVINAAMLENELLPLDAKLTSDTKLDLMKHKHLSASQENLAVALGVKAVKTHLSNAEWRDANRLSAAGMALTWQRAAGDVIQHMALRKRLVELNYLSAPRVWRP